MKIKAVKNIMRQFVCWVLLLQMINISIDPPDLKHFKNGRFIRTEDLTINEIESIYELISEVFFEKYVHERDENDIGTSSNTFNLYFYTSTSIELIIPVFSIKHSCYHRNKYSDLFTEPVFPPPKQV